MRTSNQNQKQISQLQSVFFFSGSCTCHSHAPDDLHELPGHEWRRQGALGRVFFFHHGYTKTQKWQGFGWLVFFWGVRGVGGEVKMCVFVVCMKKFFDLIENHVTYVYPCSASWGFSLGILGVVFSPINTHNYFFRASIYRVFPSTTGPTLGCTILVHPSALFPPEALHFSRGLFAPSCSCAISLRSRSS